MTDGAKTIDVSGDSGGGEALIGGNFHGAGSEVHAQNTKVGKAVISADAISRGNGGKVAVWSDGNTKFAGSISARGGALGGDGGQVETSGHSVHVADGATVVTLAAKGKSGNWLLDPTNITIPTPIRHRATTCRTPAHRRNLRKQSQPNRHHQSRQHRCGAERRQSHPAGQYGHYGGQPDHPVQYPDEHSR